MRHTKPCFFCAGTGIVEMSLPAVGFCYQEYCPVCGGKGRIRFKYSDGMERLFYDLALDPDRGEFGYRWDMGCADCEERFNESDATHCHDYDGFFFRCPKCGSVEIGDGFTGSRKFKGRRLTPRRSANGKRKKDRQAAHI